MYKTIIELSPQVPVSHRGNAHMIQFLGNAVVEYEWAAEPLSTIASQGLPFQQLYGELEAAFRLSKEAKIATMRDSMGTSSNQTDQDESKIVGIQGGPKKVRKTFVLYSVSFKIYSMKFRSLM